MIIHEIDCLKINKQMISLFVCAFILGFGINLEPLPFQPFFFRFIKDELYLFYLLISVILLVTSIYYSNIVALTAKAY